MNLSKRETIIGLITLFAILFGLTYWLAGSKIEEQRDMAETKTRLIRQIKLNKKIIADQGSWTGRLAELHAQLPVYDQRVSVTGEILKMIKNMADKNQLDLTKSRSDREKKVGTLYELSVICEWEGELDALVHFLHDIHTQGIRFDIKEIGIKPDAKRAGILRGDMVIDCAYRRTAEE